MKNFRLLFSFIFFVPVIVFAEPVVDEAAVKRIHAEMTTALESGDTNAMLEVVEKYLYPGSKIIIDMSPNPNEGEIEIEYDKYIPMLKMSLDMMGDADIHEDVLGITVDKKLNQATIEIKTIANIEMMGIKIEDISVSETTYGVIGGEIKVIVSKDQVISSGPAQE
jgi:uncharacterized protein YqgV (UPF0045/DUF77 family)